MNRKMPQAYAERKQKYIKKLKEQGKFEMFKKKKAEQEKARRARMKESLNALSKVKREKWMLENRIKTRISVHKCRQRKKLNQLQEITGDRSIFNRNQPVIPKPAKVMHSYKTKSALAKATTKTKKSLPSSPSKRKAVVSNVLNSFSAKDKDEIIGNTNRKKTIERGLSSAWVREIQKFYERNDISRMSPNVKDCRKFVNAETGEKEHKQIRHLMYNLDKVYEFFDKEFRGENNGNDPPVKISKFCALRPNHVKLLGSMPHNVCLCPYHSNFIDCCTSLSKNILEFPKYGKAVDGLLVCPNPTRDCWFKKCKRCASTVINNKLRAFLTIANERKKVNWMQWIKDRTTNRTQKQKQQSSLNELMNCFIDMYPKFLKHSYCKREQHKRFNDDVKGISKPENRFVAVLHVDFAENAKCESQDEVQSAHYNQKQVSVFTAALHHRKKMYSKAITSDNTNHSKETIAAYICKLLSKLRRTIKVLKLWTDGPSSQFKNKYMAALIQLLEKKYKLKIFWNYHAASHGKGTVDGIGAAVKHKVKRIVMSRKATVNCAEDFVTAFEGDNKSKTELMLLTNDEIDKINVDLALGDFFAKAPKINNISSLHQLQVINDNVAGFITSNDGYEYFQNQKND